jgi:DNA-nicking Smr family endonuclease
MARRRKGSAPAVAEAEQRLRSLEALVLLRGKRGKPVRRLLPECPPAAPEGVSGASGPPDHPDEGDASDAHEDARLFKAAVAGVTPLRDTGHALIETTKPAPLPRHPSSGHDNQPPSSAAMRPPPRSEGDLFREMMDDVVPLRQDGRAEVWRRSAPPIVRDAPLAASSEAGHGESGLPPLPANLEGLSGAELFRHAMRGTSPLERRDRVELERPAPLPRPIKRSEDEQAALRETMESPISLEDRLEGGDEAAFLRAGVPRRVLADLRRGRWVLQGELDLHGLKRDEAREALSDFLSTCLQQGRRCVRVIHGKGLGSPGRQSILKQLSHGWLAQREEILAFCQASPTQGGSGALMVLLRGSKAGRS